MIETQRLLIRPWSLDDVLHYQAMSIDKGYNTFAPVGAFLVKDSNEALVKIRERIKIFDDSKLCKFPIFEKDSGRFVGTCGGMNFDFEGLREVELGYRLIGDYWGKGYATEAATALVHYLLHDVQVKSIYAFALPENQASLKVIEKIGMKYLQEFIWSGMPNRLYRLDKKM